MEAALLEFLQRLEAIAEQHWELHDTICREAISEDVFNGFIKPDPNYQLPESFGMRTPEADDLVRSAFAQFLQAAHQAAQQGGLDTFQKRAEAFQNPNVRTAGGSDYEDFFGWFDPDWYDENGNRKQG